MERFTWYCKPVQGQIFGKFTGHRVNLHILFSWEDILSHSLPNLCLYPGISEFLRPRQKSSLTKQVVINVKTHNWSKGRKYVSAVLNHEWDLYITNPFFPTQDSGNIAEVENERLKEPQAKEYWSESPSSGLGRIATLMSSEQIRLPAEDTHNIKQFNTLAQRGKKFLSLYS